MRFARFKLNLAAVLLSLASPLHAGENGIEQAFELSTMPTGEKILHWYGKVGRSYFLQVSDPHDRLEKWTWAQIIEGGNDEQISHEVGGTADKSFFRLKYADQVPAPGETLDTADFDNDTLSNLTEISLHQTDPLASDSDGDGLPDNWEIAHGLLPLDDGSGNIRNGAAGLFGASGDSNANAFGSGVLPISGATIDDLDGDGIDNDEDASSRDPAIKWASASVTGFALIKAQLPPDTYPYPLDFNNKSDILFGGGKWIAGVWSSLPSVEKSGLYEPEANSEIYYDSQGTYWSRFLADDKVVADVEFSTYNGFGGDLVLPHLGVFTPPSTSIVSVDSVTWAAGSARWGLETLATDGTGRIFAKKVGYFTDTEIWLLDAELQKIGSYALPSNYAPRAGVASASGWFALSSYPSQQSSGSSLLKVWNPAGTAIEVPIPSSYDFLDLTDLPNGTPILCAHPYAGSSAVLLPNDAGTAFTPLASLADKNVTHFAGDGTGMTDNHKLWRNGALSPIRDLSKEWATLENQGWLLFPIQGNKSGVWLVDILEPEGGEEHAALLIPSALQSRNPDTGKRNLAMNAKISDPRPDVTVDLESATLNAAGDLSIRVQGNVVDRLSEAVESGRISQLHFSVNGEVVRSINLSYSPGQAPWTLADSLNEFDETLVIANSKPGAYEVRVETDENPVGNTGWGRIAVGLAREADTGTTAAVFDGLSVVLAQNHSASVIDTITVYFGNRSPASGDAIFTETAVHSGTFSGSLTIGDQASTCTLSIGDASQFQAATVDHLTAELTYGTGGSQRKILTSLKETGAGPLRFYPDGFQVNGEVNRVHQLAALSGSQPSSFEPLIMKTGVPESWLQVPDFKILVNGDEHTVKKFTVDGKEGMYVVNSAADTRPKVFIPCKNPLPEDHSVTDDNIPGGVIRWEIQFDGQTAVMQETVLLAGSPSEDGGIAARGVSAARSTTGWQAPGDTITWTDLETAYKFIYPDELSQTLLRVYLAEGHEIDLADVYGDFDFSYLGCVGTTALIEIEEDDVDIHPGIAAQYLWMGLNKALVSYSFRAAVATELGEDTLEIAFLQAYKAQVGPAAAEYGVAAAELYLSAIGIINEPLDWVLMVNEVSEGHYSSLLAALPFIPTGILKTGKNLKILTPSRKVLGGFSEAQFDQLKSALRTNDFRVVGTVVDEIEATRYLIKALGSDGAQVRVPAERYDLTRNMLRRIVRPSDQFIAHHDLIFARADWFAAHGINVNDAINGRWVRKTQHDEWHKGTDGGPFNQFWKDFIAAEPRAPNPKYTKQQILDKLAECRSQFSVTTTE